MNHRPAVRKGLITEPISCDLELPVRIQDDQFSPDSSSFQDINNSLLQCFHTPPSSSTHPEPHQAPPRLLSPFHYYPSDLQQEYYSPSSSVSSSPAFSSPSFSPANYLPPATTTTTTTTTAVPSDYSAIQDGGSKNSFLEAPSMTPDSSYNPHIHIEHTDSPPLPPQAHQNPPQHLSYLTPYNFEPPMLAQHSVPNNNGWDNNIQLLSQRKSQSSLSPPSPLLNRADNDKSHARSKSVALPQQPLPTPVQTPVQNSIFAAPFQNYDPSSQDGNHAEAEMAMKRAVMEQQQQQQQPAHSHHQHRLSDYSMAPSASSVSHNSPVTPQTNLDELDDASKTFTHGEDRIPGVDRWMDEYLRLDAISDYGNQNPGGSLPVPIPKLNRTLSDIYQDELYNPTIVPAPQQPSINHGNFLTPYRNVFANRLQAANEGPAAKSQSPGMNMNRERSPFRTSSQNFSNPATALQQSHMTAGMPMSQNGMNNGGEPKTISPKDAILDYSERDDPSVPPLFPPNRDDLNIGDTLSLRRDSSFSFRPPPEYSPMEPFPSQYSTQAGGMRTQQPFTQQQQQPPLLSMTHGLPMEPQMPSRLATQPINETISRPQDTSAREGTYTCTYHGCTLRFETPAKLQKHKREAHRQTTPGGHLSARDARNSQAGPHRCERINPTTGKPCNSIFSRPYDLTRHEDTIHNARKQKVRCHLCTEEKTFSRNDALTRHMRVVHPEVDWPGKQRRRGRE